MMAATLITLIPSDLNWPPCLTQRLGQAAPPALYGLGPIALLAVRKTALFCSAHTPGDAILRAHDAARRLRDVAYNLGECMIMWDYD